LNYQPLKNQSAAADERALPLKNQTLLASSLILVRRGGLIFFVTFFHQGKKVKGLYFRGNSRLV